MQEAVGSEGRRSRRGLRHRRQTARPAVFDWLRRLPRPTLAAVPAYIFFFVLAVVPLPFGSYDKTVSAFWCGVLAVCMIATAFGPIRLGVGQLRLLAGIGVIVLGYALVLHEQMADRPWIASFHPIWKRTSDVLGIPIAPSVSIVRGEPFFALGPTIANILALVCGLVIGADRVRARQVLLVIAWSGAAYALYGLLSFLLEPSMLLWREKRYYLGSLTATFVNRNTAAAYLGSCAVIWLALLLERAREHLNMNPIAWGRVPARLADNPLRAIVIAFFCFFFCLIALFLTTSRAGIVLSLMALVGTFVVYFRRDLPTRSALWIAVAAGAALALLLLQLFGGVVSSRFDVQGLADEGRWAAYISTLKMIHDFPWFGTGLGTFSWAFPAYRSPDVSMNGVWDIAHNTPLELASEVGLPLTLLVAAGWLLAFVVLRRGIIGRHRDVIIPLAACAVGLIANLHSLVDFSLQVPGYAIVVFGLTGVGLSQSFSTSDLPRN